MAGRQTIAPVATSLGVLFGAIATFAIGVGAYLVYLGNTGYGYYSAAVGWLVAGAFMMCGDVVQEKIASSAADGPRPEKRDTASHPTSQKKVLRGPMRRIAFAANYVLGTAGLAGLVIAVIFFVEGKASYAWPALIGSLLVMVVSGAWTPRISGEPGRSSGSSDSDDPRQPIFTMLLTGFIAAAALALGGTSILHYNPGEDDGNIRGWGWAAVGLGGLSVVGAIGTSIERHRRRTRATNPARATNSARPRYSPRGWSREQAEGLISFVANQAADTPPTVGGQSPAPEFVAALDRPSSPGAQIERLRRDLGDLTAEVRAGAAQALRRLEWMPSTERDHVLLAIAEYRWQDAAQRGDVGLRALVAALTDGAVRAQMVPALGEYFDEAFPHLVEGLEDTSRDVRAAVAEVLVDLMAWSAEPLVMTLRSDIEPETERIIVLLLGQMDESEAFERLFERTTRVRFLVDMAQGSHDIQHRNSLLAQGGALALARLAREDPRRLVAVIQRKWAVREVNLAELESAVRVACDALRYIGDEPALNELEALPAAWKARGMLLGGGITSIIDDSVKWARWSSQEHEPSMLDSYYRVLTDALAARPMPSVLARPLLREWAIGAAIGVPGGMLAYIALTLVMDWAATNGSTNFFVEELPSEFALALIPFWTIIVARSLSRRRAARSRPMRRSLLE